MDALFNTMKSAAYRMLHHPLRASIATGNLLTLTHEMDLLPSLREMALTPPSLRKMVLTPPSLRKRLG